MTAATLPEQIPAKPSIRPLTASPATCAGEAVDEAAADPAGDPVAAAEPRSLLRDRLTLWIWVACAVILVLYHFQDLFRNLQKP